MMVLVAVVVVAAVAAVVVVVMVGVASSRRSAHLRPTQPNPTNQPNSSSRLVGQLPIARIHVLLELQTLLHLLRW
jgi:archaellin